MSKSQGKIQAEALFASCSSHRFPLFVWQLCAFCARQSGVECRGVAFYPTYAAEEDSRISSFPLSLQYLLVGIAAGDGLVGGERSLETCTFLSLSSSNIISKALEKLHRSENVTEAPSNCNKSGNLWETGKKFFEYIR